MKRLIVNADGFGFGAGATRGIFDALGRTSFITSVSVNANFPEMQEVSRLVADFPHISIGVHLNPIAGRPCLPPSQVKSLVNQEGEFHGPAFFHRFRSRQIDAAELEAELDEQISRVHKLAGDHLTHLDSHQNSHLHYLPLFLRLAAKRGIVRIRSNASLICLESNSPSTSRFSVYARRPHVFAGHLYRRLQMAVAKRTGFRIADRLITVGYAGRGSKALIQNWKTVLSNIPMGTYEIYCHPGYPDNTLRRYATYVDDRRKELEILSRPDLRLEADRNSVELISFYEL